MQVQMKVNPSLQSNDDQQGQQGVAKMLMELKKDEKRKQCKQT